MPLTLNKVRVVAKVNEGNVVKCKHPRNPTENVYRVYTASGTYVGTYYPKSNISKTKQENFTFIFSLAAEKYTVKGFEAVSLIRAFKGLKTEGK